MDLIIGILSKHCICFLRENEKAYEHGKINIIYIIALWKNVLFYVFIIQT